MARHINTGKKSKNSVVVKCKRCGSYKSVKQLEDKIKIVKELFGKECNCGELDKMLFKFLSKKKSNDKCSAFIEKTTKEYRTSYTPCICLGGLENVF